MRSLSRPLTYAPVLFVILSLAQIPSPLLGQVSNVDSLLVAALSLDAQVISLHQEDRYGEAIPLAERALEIREAAQGVDHLAVATSLNTLASLYHAEARYADAEPLFQRALAIRETALDPEHQDVATVLENLAELYSVQTRYSDAEPLLLRALAIREIEAPEVYPTIPNTELWGNDSEGEYFYTTTGEVRGEISEIIVDGVKTKGRLELWGFAELFFSRDEGIMVLGEDGKFHFLLPRRDTRGIFTGEDGTSREIRFTGVNRSPTLVARSVRR